MITVIGRREKTMIKCNKCGYEGIFETKMCPRCGSPMVLDRGGIDKLRREVAAARAAGEGDMLADSYRTLALAGDTEGEREYAKLLEKGSRVVRDVDLAMEYFLRAAKKGDAESAYRYSRLISRMSDKLSRFWLLFAAELGESSAYLSAADIYAREGKDTFANYYYYMGALNGESDANVKLASRYFYGEGLVPYMPYAKWYMEKLIFPPIHALKLAYKLRQVTAEVPPVIKEPDNHAIAYALIAEAKEIGEREVELALFTSLANRGCEEATCALAELYLEGRVTKRNPDEAVRILTCAAASGNGSAYISLGKMYMSGYDIKRDLNEALKYFEAAKKLCKREAIELIADIYHNKSYEGRDVAHAYDLYREAEAHGFESAGEKANVILSAREGYYYHATRVEEDVPKDAFRGYAVATVMGHVPAMLKLAECYALGIGVQRNRKEAFLWYKKAYESGLDEASLPLGVCYSRGVGVAFDYRLAIKHLTRAAELGENRAVGEIQRLNKNRKTKLTKRCYSTAMRLIYMGKYTAAKPYLDVAVNLCHPKATYTLGALYEFGRGVGEDRKRAYALYIDAEDLGFSDPRSKYKSRILRMLKKI